MSPVIDIVIHNHNVKAMVDTGSTVSLVSEGHLRDIGISRKEFRNTQIKLNCFLDNPIKVLGCISLRINFGKESFAHDFVVVPAEYMSTPFLIGFDLLSRNPFSWENNILRWNNVNFPVKQSTLYSVSKVQRVESTREIVSEGSLRLKRKQLMWYEVGNLIPDRTYFVQSYLNPYKCKAQLLGKCFVLQSNTEGILHLPIYSETGAYLRKGSRLAHIEGLKPENVKGLDVQLNYLPNISDFLHRLEKVDKINLCSTHKFLVVNYNPNISFQILETPLVSCMLCNPIIPTSVNNIYNHITNDMTPFMDQPTGQETGRKEKLSSLFQELDLSHLKREEKDQLRQVILENDELFVLGDQDMGLINLPDNHIPMLDKTPVRMPLYRHPERAKEIISTMIQNMLDRDIIEESYAVYLSPIVLISKPDGSKRLCIDYRGVNKNIKLDIQPLPRLDELVEEVAGNKYYCTLDLKDAYYQCQLDEESRDITTFSDGKNLYRFKRLPFGLSVAPAMFTRVMQEVLKPLIKLGWCRNYLDDVIIYAPDFKSLISRLHLIFQRMSEMGLKLNVTKCQFAQRKIKFLGHFVSEKGIEVNPEHIQAIQKMKPPRTTKEVRQFIGMCSFYRKYIHNFSKIASPLTALQSKKVTFSWDDNCQQSFEQLKTKLCETPVLTKADLTRDFELHADASNEHVGAVLMQVETDGLKPIGYFSKKLNKCEKRYSVTDKEALAVVKSCRFFHHYLWGKYFKIVTDHQPLTSIFKKRTHSPRMTRYMLEMRDYNFKIVYRQGISHRVPDALSRPPNSTEKVRKVVCNDIPSNFPGLTPDIIKREQRKDPKWEKVIEFCEGGKVPKKTPGNRTLESFELREGILYLRREEFRRLTLCLVIPDSLKAVACNIAHNTTHFGQHKSVRRARQYFYWPRLWQDVVDFVRSCKTCQQFKREGALVHRWNELPPVGEKGVRVAIDLIDLVHSSSGPRYCLTMIDHFSRFIRAYPLRNKTSSNVLRALKQDISIFGVPQIALSDHGSEFTSQEFKSYCRQVGIQQVLCLPYHPRGNSVLERAHRTLKSVLSMLSQEHPNSWPLHLPESVRILNESVHTSLGTSPFFVQFGYHPKRMVGTLLLPEEKDVSSESNNSDLKRLIMDTVKRQTGYYREQANVKRSNNSLEVGELAWVYIEEPIPGTAVKLNRKWKGPFKITKRIGDDRAYELENCFDGSTIQRAAGKLKRFIQRSEVLGKLEEAWLTEQEQDNIVPNVRNRRPPDRLQY